MVKELMWYLEDGRFCGIAGELDGAARSYAEAREGGAGEGTLGPLREAARGLFEWHCARAGLRVEGEAYVNVDAEFLDGGVLDEAALDRFIKEILKGHCRQKVLWGWAGTTGNMTAISRLAMGRDGHRHGDHLPAGFRGGRPPRRPLEGAAGANGTLVYLYGDGTGGGEYDPEKARLRFDRLGGKSGIDWSEGYDPNGAVRKEGWHGEFGVDGVWARVEDGAGVAAAARAPREPAAELIRDGDAAILYDPGMLLVGPAALLYLTERGEPYGRLEPDPARTAGEIRRLLGELGVEKVAAVGGLTRPPEGTLEAYREALGEAAAEDLRVMGAGEAERLREGKRRRAAEAAAEGPGLELWRTVTAARGLGAEARGILEALEGGTLEVPLSVSGGGEDARALGLEGAELEAVLSHAPAPGGGLAAWDAAMCNILASWEEYAPGGMGRAEVAALAAEHAAGGEVRGYLAAETDLGRIIGGPAAAPAAGGARLARTGIPGVFAEPPAADFYQEGERDAYLGGLERRKILTRGLAEAAKGPLSALPPADRGTRERVNRGLTRSLGQYREVAASTGMPLRELVEAAVAAAEGRPSAALGRRVSYELPLSALFRAAGRENRQRRRLTAGDLAASRGVPEEVVIGGAAGRGLDEALGLTRGRLAEEYGYGGAEAARAEGFLHGIRARDAGAAAGLLPLVEEALRRGSSGGYRGELLRALDGRPGVGYNLGGGFGRRAYLSGPGLSWRGAGALREHVRGLPGAWGEAPFLPLAELGGAADAPGIRRVNPGYRDAGGFAGAARAGPGGVLERMRPAGAPGAAPPAGAGKASAPPAGEAPFRAGGGAAPAAPPAGAGKARPLPAGGPGAGGAGPSPAPSAGAGRTAGGISPEPLALGEGRRRGLREGRDAELERLRRIEANYERDRAELERERRPALARSASHDVGHAGGEGEEPDNPRKAGRKLYDAFVDRAKRRSF